MPETFGSAEVLTAGDLGLAAVAPLINHLVGVTATVLTRPAGCTVLVLHVEVGSFHIRRSDTTTSPVTLVATTPESNVTNGNGSMLLSAGEKVAFAAPSKISVIGADAGSVLTYYWM